MARPSKHERRAQRTAERIQSLLARGRIGDAADALLAAPRAERTDALAEVASAMESEIRRAYAEGTRPALLAWLGRTWREPRLLEVLGARGVVARYALLTAALRARMWPNAESLWQSLREPLAGHPLFVAIDAVVSTHGEPPADVLAGVESDAERLGYDTGAGRAVYPVPCKQDELERCCLACFGSEPWFRFRDVILGWLRDAPAEHARQLRILAAELSEPELLSRSRRDGANVAEVVRFIASLAADAGAPSELEPLLGSCLRALYRSLLASKAAPEFEALSILAPVLLKYDSLRSSVAAVILGAPLQRASRAKRLELLRCALAAEPSSRNVVAVAIALRGSAEEEPPEAPSWFVEALESALAEPAPLVAALGASLELETAQSAHGPATSDACSALLEILPVSVAVAAVDALWDQVGEVLRRRLALACDGVFLRMETPAKIDGDYESVYEMLTQLAPELRHAPKSELRRMLDSGLGAAFLDEFVRMEGAQPIRESFRPLARRLTARTASYSLRALQVAVRLASDPRQATRAVDDHLARLPTLLERLHALASAVSEDLLEIVELIEKRCCEQIIPSAVDAARSLLLLERASAPRRIRNSIARALLEAIERETSAGADPEIARAVQIAKRRVKPRKAPAKRGTKTRNPKNLDLPFVGELEAYGDRS